MESESAAGTVATPTGGGLIEPEMAMALNVHSSPGVYALLLGAGISIASRGRLRLRREQSGLSGSWTAATFPTMSFTTPQPVFTPGDYADLEQRNTVDELETYPDELQELLERILDEYGLIVCGWSADWDKALVRAPSRAPGRAGTRCSGRSTAGSAAPPGPSSPSTARWLSTARARTSCSPAL